MINIRDRRGRISSRDWRNGAGSVTGGRAASREKPRGCIAPEQPKTNHKLPATCPTADDTRGLFPRLDPVTRQTSHGHQIIIKHIFEKLLPVMTLKNYEPLFREISWENSHLDIVIIIAAIDAVVSWSAFYADKVKSTYFEIREHRNDYLWRDNGNE